MKLSVIFHSLVQRKSDHRVIQLFRYTAVTIISSAIDFSLLFILTESMNLHYLISAILAYSFGLIVNYVLCVIWVFHKKKLQSKALEFIIFTVIGLLGMGINELLLWVFTDIFHFYFMISRLISAVIGFIMKYALRKWILF